MLHVKGLLKGGDVWAGLEEWVEEVFLDMPEGRESWWIYETDLKLSKVCEVQQVERVKDKAERDFWVIWKSLDF